MRTIFTSILVLFMALGAVCQAPARPSDEDMQRFRAEIRTYKHEFLTRELKLTQEQQREFFPVYDEMDDAVDAIARQTRDLEMQVRDKADATDVEIEAAARAMYEQKGAEGAEELKYFESFRRILEPRQLLMLKNAERKFTRELMRQHRRASKGRH